jgi:hypothetical protein
MCITVEASTGVCSNVWTSVRLAICEVANYTAVWTEWGKASHILMCVHALPSNIPDFSLFSQLPETQYDLPLRDIF